MTDGVSVQVLSGLAEGDVINEFVPGAESTGEDCTTYPDGSTECFSGGVVRGIGG